MQKLWIGDLDTSGNTNGTAARNNTEVKVMDIPTEELVNDLTETNEDICWCEAAVNLGITHYTTEGQERSLSHRLEVNKQIKEQIETELRKRGVK